MNTKRFPKFLATFNLPGQQPAVDPNAGQAPAPQAAPPAPIPQVVPVDSLGQLIDLSVQRALKAAAPAPAPVQAPPPARQAQQQQPADEGLSTTEAAKLRKELRESNARAEALALETYKLQKVGALKASGVGLIDALIWGTTQAEIDQAIAYSQQEFLRLQQEFIQAQNANQQQIQQQPIAPVIQQPGQPTQPQVPQGFVTQQGAPAPQPAPQGIQPPPPVNPGLPGYQQPASAGAAPHQQEQGITPEQLASVTSSHAVRTGTYAANREAIMAGLRQASGGPSGQAFSFNPGYNLAPPVPRGAPAQAPQATGQHPAMIPNTYAGVQIPQVRPQQSILTAQAQPPHNGQAQPMQVNPNFNPNFQPRQAPVQHGFSPTGAPQPADLQVEQAPGVYAPNGQQLDANGTAAAQNAAQKAIQGMRGQASRMAPTH